MVPEHAPGLELDDIARAALERVEQKRADAHGADEADPVGVGLCLQAEAALRDHAPDLGLIRNVADGKEGLREHFFAHAPQEIGLVLVLVGGTQQARPAVGVRIDAPVVARGHKVRARGERLVGEGAELDGLIAHDVGVRREAVGVGVDEVVDDGGLVFGLAVPDLEVDAQAHRDALGVREVVGPGALEARQVARPVAHIDRCHVMTRLAQKRARERGVDATG